MEGVKLMRKTDHDLLVAGIHISGFIYLFTLIVLHRGLQKMLNKGSSWDNSCLLSLKLLSNCSNGSKQLDALQGRF